MFYVTCVFNPLHNGARRFRMDKRCALFLETVEQFLKKRQERSMDPPQTSGRLTAGKTVIPVHTRHSRKALQAWAPSRKLLCTPQIQGSCRDRGSANHSLWATSYLLPAFVNKILLEYSCVHVLTYCLWLHLHSNSGAE